MSVAAEWPPRPPGRTHPPQWRPPGLPDPSAPPSRLPSVLPAAAAVDDGMASRLLWRRLLVLNGRLDDPAAAHAVATLLLLDEDDHRPIRLHLSTDDADLDSAALIADTVDLIASPVHVLVIGAVGGAALAVVAAAAERTAHPHALVVLRDPQRDGAPLTRLHERLSSVTGRAVEQVAADMHSGRVLSAAEAVEYGLVQRLAGRSGTDGLD